MPGLTRRLLTLLGVLLTTACVLGAPACFIYNNARNLIVTEIGDKAINISVTVAAFVDNEIERFLALPAYVLPDADVSGTQEWEDTAHIDDVEETAVTNVVEDTADIEDVEETADTEDWEDTADTEDWDFYLYDGPFYGEEDYVEYDAYDVYDDTYGEEYIGGEPYSEDEFGGTWEDEEWIVEGYEDDALPVDTRDRFALFQKETGTTASDGTLTEEYLNELSSLLARISKETGAEVYIEKRVSETTKGYVLEQWSSYSGTRSSRMTHEEISLFNEGQRSTSDLLHDSDIGEYLKGYAPITDPETGNTAGLVVTEFALSDAYALISGISNIIIISFVVMFLLTSVVVYRLISSRVKYLVKDVLTDLCNRRYFEKVLKRQVRNAKITGRPLSLMMIDVDHFKQINDTMGHGTGDEVLKAVSNVLLHSIRRFDVCCRYGGDEFVVVLPGTAAIQAAAVAERMRGAVSSLQFSPNGQPFGVTLSIGIAEYCAHMTAEALKAQADHAMYGSKNAGKNRVTVIGVQTG